MSVNLNHKFFVSNARAKLFLLLHKVCKAFHCELYVETHTGVKVLGRKQGRQPLKSLMRVVVVPNDVRLFVDGLQDSYTIVSETVETSPHFDFIRRVQNGEDDIIFSDYVLREATGKLDGRFEQYISIKTIRDHIAMTGKNCKRIESGDYAHPKLIYYKDEYYAIDGKHRLAAASFLHVPLECEVVSAADLLQTPYILGIYNRMKRHPDLYQKNLDLLERLSKGMLNNHNDET